METLKNLHRPVETRIKNGIKKYYINNYRIYWYAFYPEFWKFFDNIDKSARIVDLGAGGGIVSDELLFRGFNNIELIDIEDLRVFEELKPKPFYKININFDKLPLEDNSVDLIVSTSVIEHLENQHHYLREIYRVLKPGGKFVLTLPNSWNFVSRLLFLKRGIMEGYYGTNYHISPITKNIFYYMIKNFKIIDKFYSERKEFFIFGKSFKLKFPRTEAWSYKVCYFLEK